MKEFDNIEVKNLNIILNKDTILERFYSLIPLCPELTDKLIYLKITDKYTFLHQLSIDAEDMAIKLGIDMDTLKLLKALFHLYDFKDRKLNEIKCANSLFIKQLISDKIKKSKEYLLLCISNSIESISEKYEVSKEDIVHLFDICDLMRLPGVKDIRASLYYSCGYKRLQEFAKGKTDNMRKNIEQFIIDTRSDKSVPPRKELSTQISVAKVLPLISPLREEI